MATTPETQEQRSLIDLLKELRDETTLLMRQEVALAKNEMSEKASRAGRNVGYLTTGGMIAYAGLLFILLAISAAIFFGLQQAGLTAEVSFWLAPLIVGLVVAIIGYAMLQKALSTLKRETIVPEKTVASLKEDRQWVEQKAART